MAATKTYTIEINGIKQAISEFDALIAKAEQLGKTLSGGATVEVKADATQVVQVQAEVTKQVQQQTEALKEQQSIVQGTTGEYAEALQVATAILGTYDENIKKLAEYDAKLRELAATKKEYEKAGVSGDQMADIVAKEMQYKQLKQETLSVIRTETKLLQSTEGSYDKMAATVARLRDALRASGGNLSDKQFTAISSAVTDLDKQLKDADKSMGQFFRNVGNYASAADGFGKIKVEVAGVTKEFDGLRPAIMEIKNAMAQLAVQGQTDTEAYAQLGAQMKQLQLAMTTVNDEMEHMKYASQGLHTVLETVQGFVAIGTIGQGISNLFGLDDSELGEQIRKMQALMGILQGLNALSTQMATGTGIGPALSKLFDVTGVNAAFKQLTASAKEASVAIKGAGTSANTGAGGMAALGATSTVAANGVKLLFRALAASAVIGVVLFAVDALVEGIKYLITSVHDFISLSDDVERSNKAMENSFDDLSDTIDAYNDARDREVSKGLISQYEGEKQKLDNYNKSIAESTKLMKANIDVNARNAEIEPKIGNWDRLKQEVQNISRLQAEGREETSTWGEVYTDVLGSVIAEMQTLDLSTEQGRNRFLEITKQSSEFQAAITWAANSGNEAMRQLASTLQVNVDKVSEMIIQSFVIENRMNAITKNLRRELELRKKYGDNWRTEAQVLDMYDDVKNSKLTDEEKAELKKRREEEIRAVKNHGTRVNAVRKRTANDAVQIERNMQQDKLVIMNDGLTKTLAAIDTERRRRLDELSKMNADQSTMLAARNAINERYDKEAADARKKWDAERLKEEREMQKRLYEVSSETETLLRDAEVANFNVKQEKTVQQISKQDIEKSMEQFRVLFKNPETREIDFEYTYEKFINEYKYYTQYRNRLLVDLQVAANEIMSAADEGAAEEIIKAKEARLISLNESLDKIEDAIKQYETPEIIEKVFTDRIGFNQLGKIDDVVTKLYSKLNVLDVERLEREKSIAITAESDRLKNEKAALEESYRQQLEAFDKRQDLLITDKDEAIKIEREKYENLRSSGKATKEELESQLSVIQNIENERLVIIEQGNTKRLEIQEVFNEKAGALTIESESRRAKIIADSAKEQKRLLEDTYAKIINQHSETLNSYNKSISDIKETNFNDFGFFNIKKFRKQRDAVVHELDELISRVEKKRATLQVDISTGSVSGEEGLKKLQELTKLLEQIQRQKDEVKSDNGLKEYFTGFDFWVQVGNSMNQIFSSIFDYRNSMFDKAREELDARIEIVQEKYDEMEELARKHKDNMNEIESELTNARGDRRQHLIDALNDEIAAQRRALAEQQRAEKEKQKLEKEGDKLELERKKEQKRQSLITATMNTALAITQAAANKWPVPAIPLMALAAAVGAAQISSIAAQHYADGGLLQGPSHAQGGIKVTPQIEVEGGEYVTNKNTTRKNLPLLTYINSKRRKIELGDMMEFFSQKEHKPMFGVKGKYADGGLLPSVDLVNRVTEVVVARDDRDIVVSVVDINDAQNRVARVQTMAGL